MSEITLPDLLRTLPLEQRAHILGDTFAGKAAPCQLVSRELRELFDGAVTNVQVRLTDELATGWRFPQSGTSIATYTPGLARFPNCSHLDIRLGSLACSRHVSLLVLGGRPQAKQRVTRLRITAGNFLGIGQRVDVLQVLEALVPHLPRLEDLRLWAEDTPDAASSPQLRHASIFSTLATWLPHLRCLKLPVAAEPTGIRLLADGCPRLQDLQLTACRGVQLQLSQESLEALARMQSLESLELGYAALTGRERCLPSLLSRHRPPNLRNLRLGRYGVGCTVEYAPGLAAAGAAAAGAAAGVAGAAGAGAGLGRDARAGAGACGGAGAVRGPGQQQAAGGWGIRSVQAQCTEGEPRGLWGRLARVLVAAAHTLRQASIPELEVADFMDASAWRPKDIADPEAALPRFARLFERVNAYKLEWVHPYSEPAHVASLVWWLGLPECLELHHGMWWGPCCGPVGTENSDGDGGDPDGGDGCASAAATGTQTAAAGGHQQGYGGSRGASRPAAMRSERRLRLRLETATPLDVLWEAAERLWAEKEQQQEISGAAALDAPTGPALHMVLVRGLTPGRRDHGWMSRALRQCLQAYDHHQQQRLPAFQHLLRDCDESSLQAPAAGLLYLTCKSRADAERLAALMMATGQQPAAGGADGGDDRGGGGGSGGGVEVTEAAAAAAAADGGAESGDGGGRLGGGRRGAAGGGVVPQVMVAQQVMYPSGPCEDMHGNVALHRHVFQVLMELWSQSQQQQQQQQQQKQQKQQQQAGAGGGDAVGGGGRAGGGGRVRDGAEGHGTRLSTEARARLERLLTLDAKVARLWEWYIPNCHVD